MLSDKQWGNLSRWSIHSPRKLVNDRQTIKTIFPVQTWFFTHRHRQLFHTIFYPPTETVFPPVLIFTSSKTSLYLSFKLSFNSHSSSYIQSSIDLSPNQKTLVKFRLTKILKHRRMYFNNRPKKHRKINSLLILIKHFNRQKISYLHFRSRSR